MSEILTDTEVASLDHALHSVAMPENFRMMVDRLFESHFALTEKLASQTPLQAAALAALVMWRKADKARQDTRRLLSAEMGLREVADQVIEAQEATS